MTDQECPICGLYFDPGDGMAHDTDDNGNEMCYDCTMKLRHQVPEEAAQEPKGFNYLSLHSAKDILSVLDPVRGTVGKGADLVLRTDVTGIKIVMYDAARICGIQVDVSKPETDSVITEFCTDRDTVRADLDKFIEAAKWFSDECVTISAEKSSIVMQSNRATRRMPRYGNDSNRFEIALAETPETAVLHVPFSTLKRILPGESIEEVMEISTFGDRATFTATDDKGNDSYTVYADMAGLQPECKAKYGFDCLKEIVNKIHLDKDALVRVAFATNAPLVLEWEQGPADFKVVIAPRTEY